MKASLQNEAGEWMHPGDWIEFETKNGKCTGRFSGVWVNPNFGLVAQTVFTKIVGAPEVPADSFFFILRSKHNPEADTESYRTLRGAKVIPKPGRKKQIATGTVH